MLKVLIRGGGDLASATARRLHLAGCFTGILERAEPRCVRRGVCYASAIQEREIEIEGVSGQLCSGLPALRLDYIPVVIDENAAALSTWVPDVLVDARMLKRIPDDTARGQAGLVLGLGPGFTAAGNCDAVIETMRGHDLGRVLWQGRAAANTGVPEPVNGYASERLLRAPCSSVLASDCVIGQTVVVGELVATVAGQQVQAQIGGVLRGLLRPGLHVQEHEKIGDIDPRGVRRHCFTISDKANAVAGGVLEAILTKYCGRL